MRASPERAVPSGLEPTDGRIPITAALASCIRHWQGDGHPRDHDDGFMAIHEPLFLL
jgi:hypothetical protein